MIVDSFDGSLKSRIKVIVRAWVGCRGERRCWKRGFLKGAGQPRLGVAGTFHDHVRLSTFCVDYSSTQTQLRPQIEITSLTSQISRTNSQFCLPHLFRQCSTRYPSAENAASSLLSTTESRLPAKHGAARLEYESTIINVFARFGSCGRRHWKG